MSSELNGCAGVRKTAVHLMCCGVTEGSLGEKSTGLGLNPAYIISSVPSLRCGVNWA